MKIVDVEKSKSNDKNSQDKNIEKGDNQFKNMNVKSIHCSLVRIWKLTQILDLKRLKISSYASI